MKKTIKYLNKKLFFTYDFNDTLLQTLFLVYANEGCAEFENRDIEHLEDVDGNAITWKSCDELVELGLLIEDEESYSVYYEISEDGKTLVNQIKQDI